MSARPSEPIADFPAKLAPLFQPKRYKILKGGRGGSKSWGIARALLLKGANEVHKVGCFREFQNSIDESVHALLTNQINGLGLAAFYDVQKTAIVGRNGTEFYFRGLKRNVDGVKSIEGTTIAWVEEANNVSKSSWETLIPTIREDGSEIWISFNPQLESDETYKRFVLKPPAESITIDINWRDNPWFNDVLRQEKDELLEKDPDAYLNVWEGKPRHTLDGAVYAAELRAAEAEGRITKVTYDPSKPVHTAWDLGRADMTSIWFFQIAGLGELRVIDFYENNGKPLPHYLVYLQTKNYVYGTDYMPHDADSEHLAADKSIAGQARAFGRTVRVIPRPANKTLGISAARTLFPIVYFDAERCADGIQCLRHYRYDVDEDTKQFSNQPLHDRNSHAADGFQTMALGFREPKKVVKRTLVAPRVTSWMGA